MMRRRAKGEGGIYRRADGRWCAALDLGRATGKRRRRIVYGKSRREVSEKLFALRKDAERGGLADRRVAEVIDLQVARGPVRPVKKVAGGDLELLTPEDEASPPGGGKGSDEDAVYPSSRDLFR